MAYVGRGLTTGAQYQKLDTITVNNVDYFTMNVNSTAVTPAPEHLILAVNGVIQEPNVGFTLSGSTCTLASAIDNDGGSDTIWGMIAGDAAYAAVTALNNATANELVTVGSTTTELDAEANLTFDGTNLDMPDSIYARFGTGNDLQLYHDGSNSFIQQSGTGALKLATEDSGKAVSIGHTTSETTVNDNLTVTGDLSVTGTDNVGITHASQWRITSAATGAGDITSNWEVGDSDGYGSLGSAMSESSGIFTFPSTGFWYIQFTVHIATDATTRALGIYIYTTVDDGTYGAAARNYESAYVDSGTYYAAATTSFLFDVADVATHKCKFNIESDYGDVSIGGQSTLNRTHVNFIRLGDT